MPARPVYLDHAATTPVRPEVLEAMLPYLTEQAFGNPSSAHRFGRAARAGLEQARREVAQAVDAEPNQVIFTSGGTEADNLGILGAALAARDRGAAMCAVVSAIEHKAILAAAHAVCHLGGREVLLPVDADGRVALDALDAALRERPAVVSVMWVNNEVGVVQAVREIAGRCCQAGVAFHTDAVQAFGKVPVDLAGLGCTLASLSGHKIGAPKGIGALVVRDRKAIEAIIHGGGQQYGIRPGTENVPGAVAMGRAAALAAAERRARGADPGDGAGPGRQCRGGRACAARAEHRRAGGGQRGVAHASRPRGRRGLERVGLLHRCGRAVARARGHGRAAGAGTWHRPPEPGARHHRGRRDPRGGGHARCGGQGAEAGGSARSCVSACWLPCRAAWTAR
jgi:hypothetical protein